ncbi:hypothetical protein HBN50_01155 [Halobacteriovorax sp. GB3]|uniref:hypothetical protein n=1 Tax=Halobacteriovorax sp. GB3 TaxID=2719615 RepID=UPI002360A6EC|nr:hypothetical protein [Halobacteriovorax sp. GB3]MDD0851675.1 hypothetical protein [Halobacteriovorax sp. GB3]
MKLEDIEKKAFLVGGAVRDKLLGLEVSDFDYVLIGINSQELIDAGFTKVGKSFDVFLHPKTKNEYALLRGQNKYSLEEDLKARDLTINSMAMNYQGEIIDPCHGQNDIKKKILRHSSDLFEQDLIRIFRLARFQAKLCSFKIAKETKSKIKELCSKNDLSKIPGERILKEIEKAFKTNHPSLFFNSLKKINVLLQTFPQLNLDEDQFLIAMENLDRMRLKTDRFKVLMATLLSHIPSQSVMEFCQRYKLDNPTMKLSILVHTWQDFYFRAIEADSSEIIHFLRDANFKREQSLTNDFIQVLTLKGATPKEGEFLLECQTVLSTLKIHKVIQGPINAQKIENTYLREIEKIKMNY